VKIFSFLDPNKPKIGLINTGNELLNGNQVNSHLRDFAELIFNELGCTIDYQRTVPDKEKDIRDSVKKAAAQGINILIMTGGLGAVSDDKTRDIIAKLTKSPLQFHERTMRRMIERRARKNKNLVPGMERMAMVPRGAHIIDNDHGMAPGITIRANVPILRNKFRLLKKKLIIFLLPGPGEECLPMLKKSVVPIICKAKGKVNAKQLFIPLTNITEPPAEDAVREALERLKPNGLEWGMYMLNPKNPQYAIEEVKGLVFHLWGTPEAVEKAAEIIRQNEILKPHIVPGAVRQGPLRVSITRNPVPNQNEKTRGPVKPRRYH
jgi:molybdopterin-biosynthesis enzyme MoeA-like protein